MAEEFLPIAQPAARPEPASVSKPASRPSEKSGEPNDVKFGDLIDAAKESDAPKANETGDKPQAAGKTEASGDATAAAAAPAAPAPPPVANTATNSILSVLQALGAEAGKADGEVVGDEAEGETSKPADSAKPANAADPAALLAQLGLAPAAQQTAATATPATAAKPVAAAVAAVGVAKPKAGQPAANAAADMNTTDEAPAADAAAGAVDEKKPAAPVTAAAATAAAALPAAPKAETAKAAPESTPGGHRAADNAAAVTPSASDNSKASSQAQPASPAAAAVQPGNAQQNTQAQASADTPADIKVDVTATSTNTSTPAADALTGRTQTADAPKTNPAMATASPAVVQVYTRMVERMDGRAQRFEIRLDPAELGRVDVKIEVGADHKVHAVLAAHDSAALSDLMRGQKALERALSDAGIDLADGGLQFEMSQDAGRSLTGNEQRETSREQSNVWRGFDSVDVGVDADARDLVQATRSYRRAAARLDLVA